MRLFHLPMHRVFTRSVLSLAVTMALTMLAGNACAASMDCVVSAYVSVEQKIDENNNKPLKTDRCVHEFQEDRAAVLLPSENANLEQLAAGAAWEYRWGFIDKKGQLVIPPHFESVSDFHFGLAAAKQDGKWGYIDLQGQWVITPRFDDASDFIQHDMANVSQGDANFLIDRSGARRKLFDDDVDHVVVKEGMPVYAEINYKQQYSNWGGKHNMAPVGTRVDDSYGSQGWIIATDTKTGLQGVQDEPGHWLVEARYRKIDPPSKVGGLGIAESDDEVVFIRPDGSLLSHQYVAVSPLGTSFWLASKNDQDSTLLDFSGEPLQHWNVVGYMFAQTRMIGDLFLYQKKDSFEVYQPGQKLPHQLGKHEPYASYVGNFAVFLDVEDGNVNILTPKGEWIASDKAHPWLRGVEEFEAQDGYLTFRDKKSHLLMIVDENGHPILSEKTRQVLGQYSVEFIDLKDANWNQQNVHPLALLQSMHCCMKPDNNGMLLSDGSIIVNSKWAGINLLETEGEKWTKPADLRFLLKTSSGVGLLNGLGQQILAPEYENITAFDDDHALLYQKGKLYVIDRALNQHALPDFFEATIVSDKLVRFRETAAEDALWGLYNFDSQQVVAKDIADSIGSFNDGFAIASKKKNDYGVIDEQGQWKFSGYRSVKRLTKSLWLASLQDNRIAGDKSDDDNEQLQQTILRTDGTQVIPPSRELSVEMYKNDAIGVTIKRDLRWLLQTDGRVIAGGPDISLDVKGQWINIQHDPELGYLNNTGEWKILPRSVSGSPFVHKTSHTMISEAEVTTIIDEQGKSAKVLPEGKWAWPDFSDWILSHDADEHYKSRTQYLNAQGEPMLTVAEAAGPFEDNIALMRQGENATWIDRHGNRLITDSFTDLGLPKNGLAYAANESDKYGFIDTSGKFVIAPTYEAVSSFKDGLALASLENASLLIDTSGKTIVRITETCGVRMLYDNANKRMWPKNIPAECGPDN